ncbi:hypothetical protein TBK1r_63640 [Stieleria magnilauensis]|uniref:Uncharacterized protein n=1 Tax=Stieleria magnilauensis TaxID=2527963 RepID=A0ABX5XZA1_9BACT|nr:hypothetical protein TBK1r_63640 [Planctomycetes bacterium TBK1r]
MSGGVGGVPERSGHLSRLSLFPNFRNQPTGFGQYAVWSRGTLCIGLGPTSHVRDKFTTRVCVSIAYRSRAVDSRKHAKSD